MYTSDVKLMAHDIQKYPMKTAGVWFIDSHLPGTRQLRPHHADESHKSISFN